MEKNEFVSLFFSIFDKNEFMRNLLPGVLAVAILIVNSTLSAQTYSKGHEDKKGEINFTEVADYYKDHPAPRLLKPVIEEEEDENDRAPRPEPDPSLVHFINRSAAKQINFNPSPLAVSLDPVDTFLSTITDGTSIPPDTHGAVDSNYCMTALNTVIRIQTKTGSGVHPTKKVVGLETFWGPVIPSGTSAFDPRVHYDPYHNRWIAVTFAVTSSTKTKSSLMIAVSKTSNPLGSWNMYSILTDATDAAWLDYPNVGFNRQWVTVTGNYFKNTSGGQTGAVVYVFDYAQLLAGTGAPFTRISKSSSFTICPALTYDAGNPNMYAVESYNSGAGQIRLWKLTGAASSPVMTSVGFPTSSTHWKGSASSDFGPQSGIPDKIDCGDDRITNLTFRNGKLWCSHNVFLPATGTLKRVSAMWWQLDTNAVPLQNGLIDDPNSVNFYIYPNLSVNQYDDAIIGFSQLSPTSHPNAGFALRFHSDALDSLHSPYIYRHGQNTYVQKFSGTKNRWGDYSGSCVDPSNMTHFYTIQESVPGTQDLWDTWWAFVKVPMALFSVVTHSSNLNTNDSFYFTGYAPAGSVVAWDFGSSASPATFTGIGPVAVKWSTIGTKTITQTVTLGTYVSTYTDTVHVANYAGITPAAEGIRSVKIVPNPNKGSFDLLFELPVTGILDVKIINLLGREVYNNQFAGSGRNKISVVTRDVPPGNYIVNIQTADGVVTQKITIEK